MTYDFEFWNCWMEPEIVCPHCGHHHTESEQWIQDGGSPDTEQVGDCESCGMEFYWSYGYDVHYTASKEGMYTKEERQQRELKALGNQQQQNKVGK